MYQNLLILTLAVVELGNVADKFGRSKGMARYMTLTELADEAIMMSKFDPAKAKEEYKKVLADEGLKASFINDIKQKFNIVDQDLEQKIEKSLEVGLKLYDAVKDSIELAKSFKKA